MTCQAAASEKTKNSSQFMQIHSRPSPILRSRCEIAHLHSQNFFRFASHSWEVISHWDENLCHESLDEVLIQSATFQREGRGGRGVGRSFIKLLIASDSTFYRRMRDSALPARCCYVFGSMISPEIRALIAHISDEWEVSLGRGK